MGKGIKTRHCLNKYYPLNIDQCKYKIFNVNLKVVEANCYINNTIKEIASQQQCVFFGGYANYLYSRYM